MSSYRVVIWAIIVAGLLSCSTDRNTEARIASLEQAATQLRSEIAVLKGTLELVRTSGPDPTEAVIDPVEKGFGIATSRNGHFLIACDGATPYLDGYKISLRIGNVHSLTYNGFQLSCRYGPRYPELPRIDPAASAVASAEAYKRWADDCAKWQSSIKEKVVSFTEDLKPGIWNPVSFVLAPVTPGELGYIRIGITTDQVSLYKR